MRIAHVVFQADELHAAPAGLAGHALGRVRLVVGAPAVAAAARIARRIAAQGAERLQLREEQGPSGPVADDGAIATAAIRRVLGRDPDPDEIERATAMVRDADAALLASQPDAKIRREWAWASYFQALMATNEFRHVD